MTPRLERLVAAGIQLIPLEGVTTHFVFERDGFVSLVERRGEEGFGNIGAPGLLTEKGFAALVWRGPEAWFVARGFEQRATDEQVASLRAFARDLEASLAE